MAFNKFSNNSKTVIKFSLFGLLLFTTLSIIIDYGVIHSDDAQIGKINKIANHTIDPEIIIFGSSVSEVGVNPFILNSITGQSVYNCSINGTRFMQYKGLINEFTAYSKNSKYIVMVESYFSFAEVDAITSADRYLAHISNRNIYNSLYGIQPELIWKCRYIPFYKYVAATNVYYKNSFIGWKNVLKGQAADSSLGFFPVSRNWEQDADDAIKNTKSFKIEINTVVLNEYLKTIKSLQNDGKKVIIVLSPMYEMAIKNITDMEPLRRTLNEIAITTNSKFLDYSDNKISTDKAFFYNSTHLNKNGADKFSEILGDSLKTLINKTQLTLVK